MRGGFSPHIKSKSVTTSATPDLSTDVSNFINDLSSINTKLILASQGKPITEEELNPPPTKRRRYGGSSKSKKKTRKRKNNISFLG